MDSPVGVNSHGLVAVLIDPSHNLCITKAEITRLVVDNVGFFVPS
jgi:hypothetical protein